MAVKRVFHERVMRAYFRRTSPGVILQVFGVLAVLALTSCFRTSPASSKPLPASQLGAKESMVPGTASEKKGGKKHPRLTQSKYLEVAFAGFVVEPTRASYLIQGGLRLPIPKPLLLVAEFENPLDPSQPFVEQQLLAPNATSFLIGHRDVPGLQLRKDYTVTLVIGTIGERVDEPIDGLEQPLRAYVDTTGPEPMLFGGLIPK